MTGLGARPLPCPFCGSANIEDEQGETYRWRRAYCVDCGARGGEIRTQVTGSGANNRALADARQDAFDEWNQRAALSPREGAQSAAAEPKNWTPREWLLNLMGEFDFSIPVKAFDRVVDSLELLSASQAAGVPEGWELTTGAGGFSDDRYACIRNKQSQCGQDFWESTDPLIYHFLVALAAAPEQQEAK